MPGKEQLADVEEMSSLADVLAGQFIQRWDLYAKQLDDGSYISVKKKLRPSHLIAHLNGKTTLGSYLLDQDSKGRFLVFDADDEPNWRRLVALSAALNDLGDIGYLERSRRGGHLWLFLAEPLPARDIRLFGQGLLDHFRIKDVELFPKQSRLKSGPGSLIRLPFGIHRKSGRRYGFYLPDGRPLAPTLREQVQALGTPETISKALFERFWGNVSVTDSDRSPEAAKDPQRSRLPVDGDAPVSERIKKAISVREFVLRYVELSPKGNGLCPFHDDHVASFSINDEDNYWSCFACQTGGSVIDFYMSQHGCDFKTAVKELAAMLL